MAEASQPIVPDPAWVEKAARLVRALREIYGDPIGVHDFGIAVQVTFDGDQGDELACMFSCVIPLPRKHGQIVARGVGRGGLYAAAVRAALESAEC